MTPNLTSNILPIEKTKNLHTYEGNSRKKINHKS